MNNKTVVLIIGCALVIVSGALYYLNNSSFSSRKNIGPIIGESTLSKIAPAIWIKIFDPKVSHVDGSYYLTGKTGKEMKKTVSVYLGTDTTSIGFAQTNTIDPSEDPTIAEDFDPWTIENYVKIDLASPRSRAAFVKIYTELPSQPQNCDEECEIFLQNLSGFLNDNIRAINIENVSSPIVIGPASQILFIE